MQKIQILKFESTYMKSGSMPLRIIVSKFHGNTSKYVDEDAIQKKKKSKWP